MPIYKIDRKRDGKQGYRVRINFIDKSTGKNRQLERIAYGSDEAKNLERELQYKLKERKPSQAITVGQLFDEYIAAKKHEVRETTTRKSMHVVKHHILPYFKDIKIGKLAPQNLQEWKIKIENTKSLKGENNLTIKTKKNIFNEFRTLLNYAVKMEYIKQNPIIKVGGFKDTSTVKKEIRFYTAEQFKKFANCILKSAEEKNNLSEWGYYVFFCIAFYTGMRKGEIHALQWNDIKGDFISIKRSITQKLNGEDRTTPPKNKTSIRSLQIPTPLKRILEEHYNRCKKMERFKDSYLICGGVKSLRDTSIENRNIKFAKMAEIEKIRIHDFRHSHASLLANNNINIQEIARRLGHAKVDMTWNTYAHLYPREEERAVQILNTI